MSPSPLTLKNESANANLRRTTIGVKNRSRVKVARGKQLEEVARTFVIIKAIVDCLVYLIKVVTHPPWS